MAPWTIGQSYGNNLSESPGSQTNTGVGQVAANDSTLTGTLETDNMELKPDANTVSAVVANKGNLGPVNEAEGVISDSSVSNQPVTEPNLLGDVIEPEATGQDPEVEVPVLADGIAPAEPDASEQPTEEAPQEQPDAGVQEGVPANPEDPAQAGEPVAEPAAPAAPLQDGLFDPSQHSDQEVVEYLATADDEERARVLQAEAEGLQRPSVIGAA